MKMGLEGTIIPVAGDSSSMLAIHPEGSIDWAFIDGDHSYDGIKKDLEAIYPKMKPDSYILCHDCDKDTDALRGLTDFCAGHGIPSVCGFDKTDMKMIIINALASSH